MESAQIADERTAMTTQIHFTAVRRNQDSIRCRLGRRRRSRTRTTLASSVRRIVLAAITVIWLGAWGGASYADTTDITDYMFGGANTGQFHGELADVDADGTAETYVVFNTVAGVAYGTSQQDKCGSRTYYFTPVYNSPPAPVRILIWFVDATAPGFVPTNSATWTYKSVPGVHLWKDTDYTLATTNPPYYFRVTAYTERNQGGTLVGTTDGSSYSDFTNSAVGIKELYVRSDYAENNLDCFIIKSATVGAVLSASPSALTPSCLVGQNAAAQTFNVWNSGSGSFMYTVSEGTSWLSCTPTNGTTTGGYDIITVNYGTAGLAAGTYNGTITVTAAGASGSPKTISVTLTVNPPSPQLSVSSTTLTPICTAGQDAASQSFDVWNSGGASMSYTVSEGLSWLSCTPTSGTSSGEHDTITVNYSTAGLAVGPYNGTITVTAPGATGSPQTINVTLTVNPAPSQLSVTPTSLMPTCLSGQNAVAQSFAVWNSGGGTLNYTISASTNWLSCTPTGGASTGGTNTIAVNYTTAGLAPGAHDATITVTAAGATGSPQTINVRLGVQSGFVISLRPTTSNTVSASWAGGPGIWLEKSLQVKGASWVAVPSSEGASHMDLPLTNTAAFFRVAALNQITQQPGSLAVAQGSPATFSVSAVGSPTPSYQWRFHGTNISGAASTTYSISSAQPSHVGDYSVVVSFGSLAVTSSPATLVLLPPDGHLTWIPAGTFVMGSPTSEVDRNINEGPQTTVTLTRGFWMGTYAVTQREYTNLMSSNPSYFTDSLDEPVEFMPWTDATNYCYLLTQRERTAGRIPANYQYQLPTEAEWEYACRAGTTTRFSYGDDPGYANLGAYAWYADNSGSATHPVGQKLPNPWGLYDMHGNVWEWCQDWRATYPGGSVTNPLVLPSLTATNPVLRGGSYYFAGQYLRSAQRGAMSPPTGMRYDVGLREVLARTVP
jgi:formylglycine-generating enzyme required for sulfatase activity